MALRWLCRGYVFHVVVKPEILTFKVNHPPNTKRILSQPGCKVPYRSARSHTLLSQCPLEDLNIKLIIFKGISRIEYMHVNNGSGSGLVPLGMMDSEPMLTQFYVTIWRHKGTMY